MVCPYCDGRISGFHEEIEVAHGVLVLVLCCPVCKRVLGVIRLPDDD